MPITISKAPASIQPLAGRIESSRATKNIVHEIIGRTDTDVTFAGTALRTGSITMLFATPALALTAQTFLAAPGVFTLADSELPGNNMRFVISGSLSPERYTDESNLWTLSAEFNEVI